MDTLNRPIGVPIARSVTMKRSLWLAGSFLTLSLGALASGCVVRARPAPVVVSGGVYVDNNSSSDYATVYPTTFAPEPIPEYRPPAPGYGYTWVDGYWDWTGYDWTWSSGYWVPERVGYAYRSEEHTSELQSHVKLVCRLLREKRRRTATTRSRARNG